MMFLPEVILFVNAGHNCNDINIYIYIYKITNTTVTTQFVY